MQLRIEAGLQATTRSYSEPPTVAEIKADRQLRLELGYGDNIRVLVNGVEQPDYVQLTGPVIRIETAANTKQLVSLQT